MKVLKPLIRQGKPNLLQASPVLSALTILGAIGIFWTVYLIKMSESIPQSARLILGVLVAIVFAIACFFAINNVAQAVEEEFSERSTG